MKSNLNLKTKITSIILVFSLLVSVISIPALAKTKKNAKFEKVAHIVSEVETMRGENEKVFRMSDGTLQAVVYDYPIHYQDDNGKWKNIDNTLKTKDDEYVTKHSKYDISLSKKYETGKTVEISDENYDVSWGFVDTNKANAKKEEKDTKTLKGDKKYTTLPNTSSETVYKNIYDGVDVEYILKGNEIKENLILNSKDVQNEFEIEYRFKKLIAVQKDDKTIQLKNNKKKVVYTIKAPVMKDNKGVISADLKLKIVEQKDNNLKLKLTVDNNWLQDKERAYPVIVDPSVEYLTSNFTYWSTTSNDSTIYGAAVTHKNEYESTYGQIGISFPYLDRTKYIVDAKLHLYATNLSDSNAYIYEGSGSYNYLTQYLFENGYYEDFSEYDADDESFTFDITKSLMKNNSSSINYTLRVDNEDEDEYYICTGENYNTPSLTIKYIVQNGINDKYSYHTMDMGTAGTVYINDLNGTLNIERNDFSIEATDLPVSIGMTYVNTYSVDGWIPKYYHRLIHYGSGNDDYYGWLTDKGELYYFMDMDDDHTYYKDDAGIGYKLYLPQSKIVTPDGDVYIFSGTNSTFNYLTTQTSEQYYNEDTQEYSKEISITYVSGFGSSIDTITDGDGNVYQYHYNNSGVLTGATCENESITYNCNELNYITSVTYKGKTAHYGYNSDYRLTSVSLHNDYKMVFTYGTEDYLRWSITSFKEYGYNSDTEAWVKGDEIEVFYGASSTYFTNENEEYEGYLFDKQGYLSTIFNDDYYALNQIKDKKGNLIGSTEVTIPVANYISNSSFENSGNAWSGSHSIETANSDNAAYSGSKYAKTSGYIYKTITGLESEETYTFSAYAKSYKNGTSLSDIEKDSGDKTYKGIGIRAVNGEYVKKSTGIDGKIEDWTRVYVTFTVPENETSMTLQVGLFDATGDICIDGLQLENHKRAYNYNIAENGDFNTLNFWDETGDTSNANVGGRVAELSDKVLKLGGIDGVSKVEQTVKISKSQLKDLSISAWVNATGMLSEKYVEEDGNLVLSDDSPIAKMSLIGIEDNEETEISVANISNCVDFPSNFGNLWYKVMGTVSADDTDYDSYKLRIEYDNQQGFLYVDGVEILNGAVNKEETKTPENSSSDPEDDYQIEDGYKIVSNINSFTDYTGIVDCSYLTYGTKENETAYLNNSWCVNKVKDKYEYSDANGNTVTCGGINISGKLDNDTQSGIRFWYKSTAESTLSLRTDVCGRPNKDYSITLPASANGSWKTILYRDILEAGKNLNDFKYIFVKTTGGSVYIDEVQTVLADTTISSTKEYKIADKTQSQNHNYPVTDEYVYFATLQDFESYTPNPNINYFTMSNGSNAYSGDSFGVTANKDKYQYTSGGQTITVPGVVLDQSLIDIETSDGIRFWYKSAKDCRISLRKYNYGNDSTDYNVNLPTAPSGKWYTMLFSEMQGKNIDDFTNLFIKTGTSPVVYIDEIHLVKRADDVYSVSENFEETRDGQIMKTANATKSLTVGGIACTLTKDTNSVGINTFTKTENETENQISATDGNGNTVNYSYDNLNNLVQMSQNVDNNNIDVDYTYNARGDISTITNDNVTYTYKYTPFGDLKSISVGNTALVTYTYVSNSNRVISKLTYANGQSLNYSYNSKGMLTKLESKTGDTITNTINYYNDETGETLKTKDTENGTVTLTYLDETQVWNTAETQLLFAYSSDEDKVAESINGTEYKTEFEAVDNTETQTDLTTKEKTSFVNTEKTVYKDGFGRITKEETKSGNTIVLLKEFEYNNNGNYTTDQIKSVKTTVGNATPETTRYTYDNNGNITGIYSKVGNGDETTVATYEYDELNQLVEENNKSFTYDNSGNILTAGNSTYSYSTGEWKDELTSFNNQSITYDDNGNPLNYLGATLTWKNGRQLASYSKGNLSVTYKYNEEGLRTEKNVNGTVYKYNWNESNLTHQSWDNKYIHFYYDNEQDIVGFTYYNGTSATEYTYVKNIQGDVVGVIDSTGNTVATYTYDAWGNILTATGDLASINPIRYRGYYYDDEIEMYYLQSRYYDQNVGRFINADDVDAIDLVGFVVANNLYNYCDNDYINSIDPSGLWKWKNRKCAVCESGDTKWGLAKEITGNGNNWRKLSKKDQKKKLYKGTKINILPLLYIWYQNSIKKNCNNGKNAYTASFNGKNLTIRVKVLFHNFSGTIKINNKKVKKSTYMQKAIHGIEDWSGNYKNVLGKHSIKVKVVVNKYKNVDNTENEKGYLNIYLDEKNKENDTSPYTIFNSPNTNRKTYKMVLYHEWENFANTARHEFGHVLGLDDAYRIEEDDEAYYAHGLPYAMAMRNDGNPISQEISMIIVGLSENKNQYFKYFSKEEPLSKALKYYY